MKRGFDIRIIIVILLILIVGFSLFDVINERLSKKEISGGVVSEIGESVCGDGVCDSVNGENVDNCLFDCLNAAPVNKKVFVLIFNPIIESQGGIKLNVLKGWAAPDEANQDYINDVKESTNNYLNYEIVQRVEVDDIPIKTDGFDYTDDSYLQCLSDHSTCHVGFNELLGNNHDEANYVSILTKFDVCSKLNNGQIDEFWIWNAPYFGFYESALVGPNGFNYNGPTYSYDGHPVYSNPGCNKLMPVMGFSMERPEEMLHNFGHRSEATMSYVFGGWDINSNRTVWDVFGHNRGQTIGASYYGCGSVHWPFNAQPPPGEDRGYRYDIHDYVSTMCDDYNNYPNFQGTIESINCKEWGCDGKGYYKWWLNHFPSQPGFIDGILNNWIVYVSDPNQALRKCGNGVIDLLTEECDDGNLYNGDDCTSTCKFPGVRFYVKGINDYNIAYFDMLGNIVLKGTCQVQASCVAPQDSLVLKNNNNEPVAYIDSQGNLCIETGDCSASTSCSATSNDEFIMQDETGKVVNKIDLTNGDLCYTVRLIENGTP